MLKMVNFNVFGEIKTLPFILTYKLHSHIGKILTAFDNIIINFFAYMCSFIFSVIFIIEMRSSHLYYN